MRASHVWVVKHQNFTLAYICTCTWALSMCTCTLTAWQAAPTLYFQSPLCMCVCVCVYMYMYEYVCVYMHMYVCLLEVAKQQMRMKYCSSVLYYQLQGSYWNVGHCVNLWFTSNKATDLLPTNPVPDRTGLMLSCLGHTTYICVCVCVCVCTYNVYTCVWFCLIFTELRKPSKIS